jgi:hypothetical protein
VQSSRSICLTFPLGTPVKKPLRGYDYVIVWDLPPDVKLGAISSVEARDDVAGHIQEVRAPPAIFSVSR